MKENINLPPFYKGQQVVALKDGKNQDATIKKGDEFVIKDCVWCGCRWLVDVGITAGFTGKSICKKCNTVFSKKSNIVYAASTLFAPIESTFESITFKEAIEIESPLISVN